MQLARSASITITVAIAASLLACGSSSSGQAAGQGSDAGGLTEGGLGDGGGSSDSGGGNDAGITGDGATTGPGDAGHGDAGDAGGGDMLPPLPPGTGSGTTYYVSPNGKDSNDGKSPSTAWQTLGKVTSTTFQAGDSVLLEGGQTFAGCPTFSGSNIHSTAAAPFTLGSYGTGRFTITANCTGSKVPAVTISGINGFILRDGILTGNAGGAEYGVWINNPGSTPTDYVRIQNCDISGFYTADTSDYGAEIFVDGIPGGLDHVLVLDSTLHGASGPTSPDDNGIVGYGNGQNITNVLYQGNTMFDIGGKANGPNGAVGNGLVTNGVDGGVVQYNVAYDCGRNTTSCGGPAGIWAYSANNVVFQYNEVYGMGPTASTQGGCDWNAYDLDGNVTNSVVQYNYSHDDVGAGLLAYISGTWSGNVFRYNISENDGAGVDFAGYAATTSDLAVYNNTIYSGAAMQAGLQVGIPGGGTLAGKVANNVFYSAMGGPLLNILSWNTATVTGVAFDGNDYYAAGAFQITWTASAAYTTLAAWSSATGEEMLGGSMVGHAVDPKLASPGMTGTVGGYEPAKLAGYKLAAGSPLIGAGLDLKAKLGIDPGTQDYFGNAIPNGGSGTGFDVGAYGGK